MSELWMVTYTRKVKLPGTWQRISLRVTRLRHGVWKWVVCSPCEGMQTATCATEMLAKADAGTVAKSIRARYAAMRKKTEAADV